jgi:hypothetical protein
MRSGCSRGVFMATARQPRSAADIAAILASLWAEVAEVLLDRRERRAEHLLAGAERPARATLAVEGAHPVALSARLGCKVARAGRVAKGPFDLGVEVNYHTPLGAASE